MLTDSNDVSTAIALIASHAENGIAPPSSWYEANGVRLGGRSLSYLRTHYGLRYFDLVRRTGLQPSGGLRSIRMAERARNQGNGGAVPAAVEAEIAERQAEAGPAAAHHRTWPLFGIPTRQTSFCWQRQDGAIVRTTRQYYSLR